MMMMQKTGLTAYYVFFIYFIDQEFIIQRLIFQKSQRRTETVNCLISIFRYFVMFAGTTKLLDKSQLFMSCSKIFMISDILATTSHVTGPFP